MFIGCRIVSMNAKGSKKWDPPTWIASKHSYFLQNFELTSCKLGLHVTRLR
jgi:hypothetical protein